MERVASEDTARFSAAAPISSLLVPPPHSFVFEFVYLPWSEVCSARVTSLLLLVLYFTLLMI